MTGLKLVYGGSIPSFLVNLFGFVRRLVPRMYDKVGDSREVILRLLMLVLRIELLVWLRRLLIGCIRTLLLLLRILVSRLMRRYFIVNRRLGSQSIVVVFLLSLGSVEGRRLGLLLRT